MSDDRYNALQQQVAVEVESTSGTVETLDSDDVKLLALEEDTIFSPEFDRHEWAEVSPDLSQSPSVAGGKKGSIAFGCVLQGSGAAGTRPALDRFLRGCACKAQDVEVVAVGAQSGGDSAFAAGETYTATGGKAGIIEYPLAGAGNLRYIPSSGGSISTSDVVTANGDSATASGDGAAYGTKYTPRSTAWETVTLARFERNSNLTSGQDFEYRLRGALGNFSIECAHGNNLGFRSTFQGVVDKMGAGDFITGYTIESKSNRPKFLNATVSLNGVTVYPESITFDAGQAISLPPDPTTRGGAAGYFAAIAGRRNPTLSIDPEKLVVGDLDELGLFEANTTFAVALQIETTAGKIFELAAPKAEIRGWAPGERGGRRTWDGTIHLTRADLVDEDFALYFR